MSEQTMKRIMRAVGDLTQDETFELAEELWELLTDEQQETFLIHHAEDIEE